MENDYILKLTANSIDDFNVITNLFEQTMDSKLLIDYRKLVYVPEKYKMLDKFNEFKLLIYAGCYIAEEQKVPTDNLRYIDVSQFVKHGRDIKKILELIRNQQFLFSSLQGIDYKEVLTIGKEVVDTLNTNGLLNSVELVDYTVKATEHFALADINEKDKTIIWNYNGGDLYAISSLINERSGTEFKIEQINKTTNAIACIINIFNDRYESVCYPLMGETTFV